MGYWFALDSGFSSKWESSFGGSLVVKSCCDGGEACKVFEKNRRELVYPYREKLHLLYFLRH